MDPLKLDPEVKAVLDRIPPGAPMDTHRLPLEETLRILRASPPYRPPPPNPVSFVEDRVLDVPGGTVPIRIYRPHSQGGLGIVLNLHGGGWVRGSIDGDNGHCHALAAQVPCVVVSVGYRLAPENKFPIPLEDCYAALQWAAAHARDIGGDASKIALCGGSAGGNLAAATTMLARDRGGPRLRAQVLVAPICDGSKEALSYVENADAPVLTAEKMRWFWAQYLRGEADRTNPMASVLLQPNLIGLPAALIIAGALDPVRDEASLYATRLAEAGVSATYRCFDGMPHGFNILAPFTAKSRAATAQMVDFLQAAFGKQSSREG